MYLISLAGEVVRRLDRSGDAGVEISPAGVIGGEDCEREARFEIKFDVDLAVLSRVGDFGFGADLCGEFFAEVCGLVSRRVASGE